MTRHHYCIHIHVRVTTVSPCNLRIASDKKSKSTVREPSSIPSIRTRDDVPQGDDIEKYPPGTLFLLPSYFRRFITHQRLTMQKFSPECNFARRDRSIDRCHVVDTSSTDARRGEKKRKRRSGPPAGVRRFASASNFFSPLESLLVGTRETHRVPSVDRTFRPRGACPIDDVAHPSTTTCALRDASGDARARRWFGRYTDQGTKG